jgi:hypothetical protein
MSLRALRSMCSHGKSAVPWSASVYLAVEWRSLRCDASRYRTIAIAAFQLQERRSADLNLAPAAPIGYFKDRSVVVLHCRNAEIADIPALFDKPSPFASSEDSTTSGSGHRGPAR